MNNADEELQIFQIKYPVDDSILLFLSFVDEYIFLVR